MSARDVVSSPDAEPTTVETKAKESSPVLENGEERVGEPDKASGSAKPFNRLVTTSAVAAAFAEVQGADAQTERPKRRRLDRRHSGLEPLVEKHATDPALPAQLPNGHRMSAPTIEYVPSSVTDGAMKPMRLGSTSPRGQLKRATSTHIAGIRERLKTVKQAEINGIAASSVKRTPSVSTTPSFKRMPSSSATPTFRSVAKAVAAGSTLTSGGTSTEQGQNYEQMMARFQLRRLEPADSGRSLENEVKVLHRRSTAYMLVDSEISQRRMDDLLNSNSTRPRSEGEPIDNTTDRGHDSDIHSRAEESPRRPGAPSFHSNNPSIVPPPTASVTPVVGGALGGSMRSISSVVKKPQLSLIDKEPDRGLQQGEKPEEDQSKLQQLATRRDSVLDQRIFSKRNSPSGGRPRPLPRFKKQTRAILTRLRTPLSPFSMTARVRSFFLLLAFCVHTLGFPYENAFHAGGRAWFISIDALTEMIFLADFLLVFNTSFVNKRGVLVVSRRHIAWNFLTGACVFQLLAALPFVTVVTIMNGGAEQVTRMELEKDAFGRFSHTLVDIVTRSHRIVHILRLLREVGQVRDARIDKSVLGWLLYSRYSHLLRIVWIVGAVMLIAHCIACCWRLLLIDSADVEPASIAETTCGAPIEPRVEFEVYTECFYVAMQMLLGQSLTTHSARENAFASCVNLLGSIVLAVIFGHVAMLVANFNANSTAYQRKMESVFAGMTKMQLPAPLRERIHQYYAHLWREYEALDGASLGRFAKELSHNLTLEVVLFKYMELAMHVPFWENCSPDFQKTLVLSLDTRVYLPDDFIVRRGEVGDEFYMINRGMCELVGNTDTQEHATEPLARRRSVANEHAGDTSSLYTTSHDGTVYPDRDNLGRDVLSGRGARAAAQYAHVTPEGFTKQNASVKTLTRGQAFGEMALLMNYQRTANVRAMTYVEMCVLSRTAFQAVLTRYPVDRKHVISQILISSLENNERFGIPCPLTAMVRSVFADEVDGVAEGEKSITPRRAAKLVAWAVNPDVEDDSIKFALSAKLKDQLVVVRDQELTAPTHPDEETPQLRDATSTSVVVSPTGSGKRSDDDHKECQCGCHGNRSSVGMSDDASTRSEPDDSYVVQLENVQAQALTLLQELQRGVQDSINPPSSSQPVAQSTSSSVVDPNPNAGPTTKPVITIQQRRSRFISNRSTSAPNFADLDVTERRDSSDLNLNENINNTVEPEEKPPSTTPPKPIQRARTARWLKTAENTRPLRPPNSLAPLVRPRGAGSSSQRFIQRVTNQLASLATSNSTVQSPTMYADQLFGTAQSSIENAPSVNMYGEDSLS